MSNLKNRVTLIGHVGQSPEVKSFDAKGKLARFSLATNDFYKNTKGEKIEDTQWHNIVDWAGLANMVETHVEKGAYLVLEGKIVNRSYETKEGEKRYITEIVANEINFLSLKKEKAA
jgi:single-strand DNA-binding protein